jgi:uncharacterized membrane protein
VTYLGGNTVIPRTRLDALTDGVFAVAMTLLVIDLKLPERFNPTSAEALIHGLTELKTQFFVYVLSFLVLGIRWMSLARLGGQSEHVNKAFAWWALAHLFLITCIPFSTMVVGRYGEFAPAQWLYAANTLLGALVALRMVTLARDHTSAEDLFEWRTGLLVVVVMSLIAIAISFVDPRHALWAYLLNLIAPALRRHRQKGKA